MEGHGAYHRKVFSWAPPPSDSGSVPALCIFLVGVLSVTITLFVRHENNSGGSDWVFRKSDAHHCVGCFHPVLLLLFRAAVCAFCMYALSRTYQGAMFYTCVPLRACWARRYLYPSLTRNAAAIQDLELRSAHSVLPHRDYQQLGWMLHRQKPQRQDPLQPVVGGGGAGRAGRAAAQAAADPVGDRGSECVPHRPGRLDGVGPGYGRRGVWRVPENRRLVRGVVRLTSTYFLATQ